MRVIAGIAVLTVGWLSAGAKNASAAWNNVFQTCCNSCQQRSSYYYAPAPSACCPTISYQQRCCYQSYTAYRQETVMEPVTTYRTSYYWAPVTSYRYTSYYDPCSCSCKQVCTPYTSYQLRSQCNAVQSYVQRCQMVPYTAYRQSCYLEPVVTYSAPACPTCPTSAPIAANPGVSEGVGSPLPQGDPDRRPLPGVSEGTDKNLPKQDLPNGRNRVAPQGTGAPIRMDRIASNSNGQLRGTIVAEDRITPRAGTRLYFAASERTKPQFSTQADPAGRFTVELPAGEWAMYMTGSDGKPVFHSQISVKNSDQRLVTVVSR
jgi:hypothetical protein